MRRENFEIAMTRLSPGGSSPRARGKLIMTPVHAQATGIIPACAGETYGQRLEGIIWEAHPRVYGEG